MELENNNVSPLVMYQIDKSLGGKVNKNRPINAKFKTNKTEYVYNYCEEYRKILGEYEYLGVLFTECLFYCWENMYDHPRIRNSVLREIEKKLELVIYNFENNIDYGDYGDYDIVVYNWFFGKLCPGVFMRDKNDLLFCNYILETYSKRCS